MSTLSFKQTITKVAVLSHEFSKGKMIPVGDVLEVKETETEFYMSVRLKPNLPVELKEAIEKNPGALRVMKIPSEPKEIIILPDVQE